MQLANARNTSAIVALLTWLMLTLGAAQIARAQGDSARLPSMSELQQEAIDLKRNVLTATRDDRAMLAEEADRVLSRFDSRITALREDIDERQGEMSAAAVRYAGELMSTLRDQRGVVQQRLGALGENLENDSANAWDRAVYNFSSAYDSFVESWGNVEANFPMDP